MTEDEFTKIEWLPPEQKRAGDRNDSGVTRFPFFKSREAQAISDEILVAMFGPDHRNIDIPALIDKHCPNERDNPWVFYLIWKDVNRLTLNIEEGVTVADKLRIVIEDAQELLALIESQEHRLIEAKSKQ
jgi:hypothetical protein